MHAIRKAQIEDVRQLQQLVNGFADRGVMLPRSLNDIYETLRDFVVASIDDEIVGCGALHVCWEGLAEIRSLAVLEPHQSTGIGAALVAAMLEEAQDLGIAKVFALTYIPEFFQHLGFSRVSKRSLPHKIWKDCLACVKFPDCDETAVSYAFDRHI